MLMFLKRAIFSNLLGKFVIIFQNLENKTVKIRFIVKEDSCKKANFPIKVQNRMYGTNSHFLLCFLGAKTKMTASIFYITPILSKCLLRYSPLLLSAATLLIQTFPNFIPHPVTH